MIIPHEVIFIPLGEIIFLITNTNVKFYEIHKEPIFIKEGALA